MSVEMARTAVGRTTVECCVIIRLSVTQLRVLNIWSHFRYLKVTAHAPCHVTSNRGKIVHIFEIPDPNFPIHFVTFRALRRRLSHMLRRKIAFSHYEGYKVCCACAVSRDLCIGGPPKPHFTIFWPRIVYSLYNFYGATMSIKGTFILEHSHVKAIFGRKKVVKIGPQNGFFFGNLRV